MLGGYRVAELKYAGHGLSPLQFATVREWPELTEDDVQAIDESTFGVGRPPVPRQVCRTIFAVSGGHPRLIQFCLERFRETPSTSDDEYYRLARTHPDLRHTILRLAKKPTLGGRIHTLADPTALGPVQPHPMNDALRLLYWTNLVKHSDDGARRFVWRSAAIRDAVRDCLAPPEESGPP